MRKGCMYLLGIGGVKSVMRGGGDKKDWVKKFDMSYVCVIRHINRVFLQSFFSIWLRGR